MPLAACPSREAPQRNELVATVERTTGVGVPNWAKCVPFVLLHLAPLAAFWTGVDARALLLCAACYLVNMVGITAGYHRYFAHRSYKTSRWFQFVLACLGCTALQKGPLWWASHHRHHHLHSDMPDDVHSPVTGGFWWSHLGWMFAPDWNEGDPKSTRDLSRYPELRWLEHLHWGPAMVLAGLCYLLGGWSGVVVGFFGGSLLSHHAVFLVNSACHLWGRRRYETADASRNNALVAVLTLGEGWHNNHHHYQSSANQGFFWWEIDISYYLIRLLATVGLVWDVRTPPTSKLRKEDTVLHASERMAISYAGRAPLPLVTLPCWTSAPPACIRRRATTVPSASNP
jgi:stearoyl-CoA desaturase (delta-9 desaturase)